MTVSRWRALGWPLAAAAPLLLALAAGLLVSLRALGRAEDALLEAETGIAARLLREPDGREASRAIFGDRVSVETRVDPTIDEPVLIGRGPGRSGFAAVYDAEGWNVVGTLILASGTRAADRLPWAVLATANVAALALVWCCAWWIRALHRAGRTRQGRLWAVGVLLGTIIAAVPALAAVAAARERLTALTDRRVVDAGRALAGRPDLEAVVDRPGGVFEFTRLPFLVRAADGAVLFSSLSPEATRDLSRVAAPAPPRVVADGVAYAVADVGRARLVFLPYETSEDPLAVVVAVLLVGALACAAVGTLVPLVRHPRRLNRELTAWSFLAPGLVLLAVFTVGPLVFAGWLSMHRWSLIDPARPFVWLDNYRALVADDLFWNSMRNTAVFTLHVPVSMAIALGLALLVRRPGRASVLARTIFFLPSITSLAAVAMVWQWMLHPEYGLANAILSAAGLPPLQWLASPATALLSVMLVSTWIAVGFQAVLFQAGLAAIPTDLYDAARIDGASRFGQFWHVTLPGLRHTLFFVLVTSVIGSFQVFGTVYVMTEGGPLHATDVAVFHIYEEAWEFQRVGSAAAMSWVLFAIIFVVTWLHFRTLERRVEAASA